jgi:hypothetical protein
MGIALLHPSYISLAVIPAQAGIQSKHASCKAGKTGVVPLRREFSYHLDSGLRRNDGGLT